MKRFLQHIFLLFVSCSLSAQNFAPVGAIWHYNLSNVAGIGDQRIFSQADTFVDGKSCREIFMDTWFHDYINDQIVYSISPAMFVYDSADIYYVYQDGKFRILYDFNVLPGGFWNTDLQPGFFGDCDSIGKVYVDSAGLEIVDGYPLKWIKVHDSSGSEYGYFPFYERIYERLGSGSYLFPYPVCVIYEFGFNLRCYTDTLLSYPANGACNFIITSSEELNLVDDFELYPNPTSQKVRLTTPNNGMGKTITIFDLSGRKIFSQKISSSQNEIDVSSLPNGIYFLELKNEDEILTKKFEVSR